MSGISVAKMEEPATTFWVMDTTPTTDGYNTYGKYRVCFGSDETYVVSADRLKGMDYIYNYGAAVASRHLETTDVLFGDGHVKALKVEQMGKRNSSGVLTGFTSAAD